MKWIKTIFSLDAFWATLVLYVIIFTVPLIFSSEAIKPFSEAVGDFKISDVYYSSLLPELDIAEETEIVIVNSVTFSPFGQKPVNAENLARFVLLAQEAGAMVIGINAVIDLDSESEEFETVIEILSQEGIIVAENKVLIDGINLVEIQDSNLKSSLVSLTVRNGTFVNSEERKHKTIRAINTGGDDNPHFALEVASFYSPDVVATTLETEEELYINFRGNYDKFTLLEASEFFSSDYEENLLLNKIVLIGDFDQTSTSDEFEKIYYTPLNENTAGRTFPDMYETLIHANIISMVISDELLSKSATWKNYVLGFLLGYVNMILYLIISRWDRKWLEFAALILFVAESFLIAFLTVQLLSSGGRYDDLTFMIFVAALSPIIFQIYMDTIRPLSRRLLNIFN